MIKNTELGLQMYLYDKIRTSTTTPYQLKWVPFQMFLAKLLSTSISYPIETIRTNKRFYKKQTGVWYIMKTLVRQNGVLYGFYRGYWLYALRSTPNAMIVFSLYEFLLYRFP